MARLSTHEKDCQQLLNNLFTEIHKYLDQYASKFPPNKYAEYHRTFLHNSFGLAIVKAKFGLLAYKAALIHLYRDWTYQDPTKYDLDILLDKTEKNVLPCFNEFKFMELPIYVHI